MATSTPSAIKKEGKEKEPVYAGELFAPNAELLRQIGSALNGGARSKGVDEWLAEFNRVNDKV